MHRRERKGAAEQTVASVSPPTLAVPASLHASPMARLDRLARNVELMESGIEFVAADMPFANKLTIHILAAVAEHEREAISARTKAAPTAAKARGVKLGGPKLKQAQRRGIASNKAKADRFAANVRPVIEQIKASGATSLPIAKALNARGVPTARGGVCGASASHRCAAAGVLS